MRLSVLLLLAVLALTGCQPEGPDNTLPSGYAYTMHTDAAGEAMSANTVAYIYYKIRLDDSLLMSSYNDPVPYPVRIPDTATLTRELQFLEEALMVMSPGDSLTINVPIDSVPNPPPGSEDARFMYYDIKVASAKTESELQQSADEVAAMLQETLDKYKAGTLEGLQELDSGLKYVIHEPGNGVKADTSDIIFANYYGVTVEDGQMFDNSFVKGQPFPFPLMRGQVIKGWDLGFAQLSEGAKATLFIPADLGYGATGSPPRIPPNAELAFYVEMEAMMENPGM